MKIKAKLKKKPVKLTSEQHDLYGSFPDAVAEHPKESFEEIVQRFFKKKNPFEEFKNGREFRGELLKAYRLNR